MFFASDESLGHRSGLVIGKAKKLGQLQRDVARLKNIEIKYLNK